MVVQYSTTRKYCIDSKVENMNGSHRVYNCCAFLVAQVSKSLIRIFSQFHKIFQLHHDDYDEDPLSIVVVVLYL